METELFIERQFHSANVVLSYVEGPSNGVPIVLIHGTASRWQPFRPTLPDLVEKYHVFALDLRGHGQSGHAPGAYHLDDYTCDVQQFIIHQVQAPAVIYGHSLGALLAINLAAHHPQIIRTLILGDPPLYYHDTPTRNTFWHKAFVDLLDFMIAHPSSAERDAWLIQNFPTMAPERREERVRSLETLDPDAVRAVISDELMKGISLPALARRVVCPVLLLRGNEELGSALRKQDVEFAVTHFPNIQMLEMEMIGHGIIPTTLLPQMTEFIDAIVGESKTS